MRRSPTMFLPHHKEGEQFIPLTNSFESTRLYSSLAERTRNASRRQLDHWHRLFIEAEELCSSSSTEIERAGMVRHICRHMIAREDRMLDLSRRYLTLQDLLEIKSRVIGTGFVGGKAAGMLLAHKSCAMMRILTGPLIWNIMILTMSVPTSIIPILFITVCGVCSCVRKPIPSTFRRRRNCVHRCLKAASPSRSGSASATCSSTTASIRLSSAPVRCWKTASAMPLPVSTTAFLC